MNLSERSLDKELFSGAYAKENILYRKKQIKIYFF